MAVHGGADIVNEGLVFCMDGASKNCNNGTTINEILNGTSGTLGGDVTLTGAYAPTFDGSADRIDFGGETTSDDFAFGTGDFTIACWFKYTGSNFNSYPYILDMRAQGEQNAAKPGIYVANDNKLQLFTSNAVMSDGSETVSVDTWHHLVYTRIGSTRYVFFDNTQTNSGSHTENYVASRVRLGSRSNLSLTQFWTGHIPILQIYKGKGFTATDVSQNFNAHRGRFGI